MEKGTIITQNDFNNLSFVHNGDFSNSVSTFTCIQNPYLSINVYYGDDYEGSWVRFVNDVSVIANESAIEHGFTLDDNPEYLNIDASPEIIFDYLDLKFDIELAVDHEESEQFKEWLNKNGHNAIIGTSTGNYVNGLNGFFSSELNRLWNDYCDQYID